MSNASREAAKTMYEAYRAQIAELAPACYRRLEFEELKPAMKSGWLAVAHEVEQRNYQLLNAVQMAYRKHHLGDESIGWEELGNVLLDALCEAMGDDGYQRWVEKAKEE